MRDEVKAFIIKMMILPALLLCLSGCGLETVKDSTDIMPSAGQENLAQQRIEDKTAD